MNIFIVHLFLGDIKRGQFYRPLYDNKGSGIAQLVERLHCDLTGSSLTGASLGLLPGLTVAGHSP